MFRHKHAGVKARLRLGENRVLRTLAQDRAAATHLFQMHPDRLRRCMIRRP